MFPKSYTSRNSSFQPLQLQHLTGLDTRAAVSWGRLGTHPVLVNKSGHDSTLFFFQLLISMYAKVRGICSSTKEFKDSKAKAMALYFHMDKSMEVISSFCLLL